MTGWSISFRKTSLQADAAADRLDAVLKKQKSGNRAEYPNIPGAQRLRTIADLIRADLGIRIFSTDVGGGDTGAFDNHANQRGNHGALLHQLSESVAAFVDDLARDNLLDRVLLMTFSEFGRTVRENGRRGTGTRFGRADVCGRWQGQGRPDGRPSQPDGTRKRRPQAPHRFPPPLRHGTTNLVGHR